MLVFFQYLQRRLQLQRAPSHPGQTGASWRELDRKSRPISCRAMSNMVDTEDHRMRLQRPHTCKMYIICWQKSVWLANHLITLIFPKLIYNGTMEHTHNNLKSLVDPQEGYFRPTQIQVCFVCVCVCLFCFCFFFASALQAPVVQWMFYGCSMDVRVLCSLDVLIYVLMFF